MFNWLKKLFSEKVVKAIEPESSVPSKSNGMVEKPCKTCGKPISIDPSWEHIPNYCKECNVIFPLYSTYYLKFPGRMLTVPCIF